MAFHQAETIFFKASLVAIGSFDGVHKGHQALILKMVEKSKQLGVPSVIYTFDPPPRVYFKKGIEITPIKEKVKRIRSLGVDYVIVAHFDDHYLNRSVYSFITELFALHPLEVFVGNDFRFGKDRSGTIEDLKEYFRVRVIEKVCCDKGKVISSTRIRELILNGKKREAQKLLNW